VMHTHTVTHVTAPASTKSTVITTVTTTTTTSRFHHIARARPLVGMHSCGSLQAKLTLCCEVDQEFLHKHIVVCCQISIFFKAHT
jgi:hypothetical protein